MLAVFAQPALARAHSERIHHRHFHERQAFVHRGWQQQASWQRDGWQRDGWQYASWQQQRRWQRSALEPRSYSGAPYGYFGDPGSAQFAARYAGRNSRYYFGYAGVSRFGWDRRFDSRSDRRVDSRSNRRGDSGWRQAAAEGWNRRAGSDEGQRPQLEGLVSQQASANGVPVSLVHRVIMRESGYNSRAVSRGNYGLMQIRLGTARAMGYGGSAAGLLDPATNMTYAVRYLAGAYRVAGGNESRAVALYARGY
jgi:soluble lytic murein transglycosylase-like protein